METSPPPPPLTLPPPSSVPRPEVRIALQEQLPTVADFEAFCIDYFPRIHKMFATGMSRIERTNLLLESLGHQRVWDELQRLTAQDTRRYAANPYRGLAAFEIEDAELFYGRTELVTELRRRIADLLVARPTCRLLPLLGATGCGKSSLLRAGLLASFLTASSDGLGLPELKRERMALFVPGDQPLRSLAIALKRCAGESLSLAEIHGQLQQPGGLVNIYAQLAPVPGEHGQLLLVAVDQLEELYALCKSPGEADQLVARLMEAARASVPIVVLVTLRTDFLQALASHPELNQAVGKSAKVIAVLDRIQLAAAITAPAEKAGCPLDPALVEELLKQAGGQQNSLPLIQFAMQRLWSGITSGQDGLTVLRRMGGIGGALAGWADSLYAALEDDGERRRAQRLFLGLVRPADHDRPVARRLRRVAELVPAGRDESATRRLLYHFSRAHHDHQHGRLLSVSSDDEVMLAHETLVTSWNKLATWLREDAAQVLLLERLDNAIAHWKQEQQDSGLLWRDPDLRKLRELSRVPGPILNRQQEEFLRASEEAERRWLAERANLSDRLRQFSRLLSVAVVGLLGCLVTLVIWFRLERQAKNLARSNSASALVAQPGREIQALVQAMQAAEESTALGPLWQGLYQVSALLVRSRPLLANKPGQPGQPGLADASAKVVAVAFSPTTGQLLSGGKDGSLALWDAAGAAGAAPLRAWRAHDAAVNSVAYFRKGAAILSASEDGTARLWDAGATQPRVTFQGHKGGVLTADLSPDGELVLTAGRDGTARVFSAKDGRPLRVIKHEGEVCSARYSPYGNRFVTASKDQLIRIFDTETSVLLRAIGPSLGSSALGATEAFNRQTDGHRGEVHYAVFSHDGRRLFTAGEDNAAIAWEVESGRQIFALLGHAGPLISIEESPDGRQLLTTSEDSTARLWDAHSGKLLLSLAGHATQLSSAAFSPDGATVATAGRDGSARLWMPQLRPHFRIEAHNDWVRSAAFSPVAGEPHILTASADGTAAIWDRSTGVRLHELQAHTQWVNSAHYSHDGKQIVTSGMDHTARIWDAATGQLVATLRGHKDWLRYAEFSPDGRLIVTASRDHTAGIWSAPDWHLERQLIGHTGAVTSAIFSSDGREILTASEDHTARRWSVQSGQEIGRLQQHEDWVRHAVYSQSGTRVLTASRDRTALIWEIPTLGPELVAGSARSPARPILTLRGHTGWVRHGAYSRDDRHVLTASGDMTARLWDAATGEPQLVLTGHSGPVSTAEFSRDGRHAVTAGRDGTVLIHAVDPDILWEFGCELLRSVREHPDAPKTYVIPLLSKCRVPGESAAAPASVGAPQPMPAQAEP